MQRWTIYGEPKHDRPLVSISAAALHRDPGQAGAGHGKGEQGAQDKDKEDKDTDKEDKVAQDTDKGDKAVEDKANSRSAHLSSFSIDMQSTPGNDS